MNLFIAHLMIAFIWMGFSEAPPIRGFFIGFIIGLFFISIFSTVSETSRYPQRLMAFAMFVIYFIRALLLSNMSVLYTVLFTKNSSLNPNIIKLDVSDLIDFEVFILSHAITLTPGTTCIDYVNSTLYVHALDAKDPKAVCKSISTELVKPILGFTR